MKLIAALALTAATFTLAPSASAATSCTVIGVKTSTIIPLITGIQESLVEATEMAEMDSIDGVIDSCASGEMYARRLARVKNYPEINAYGTAWARAFVACQKLDSSFVPLTKAAGRIGDQQIARLKTCTAELRKKK